MIFEYFIEDFIECLERGNKYTIRKMNQSELKVFLDENIDEYGSEFPMICYEHTDDSNESVGFDESKFLNDKEHEGTWIVGEKHGEVVFIMCVKDDDGELEIDTFEVATSERKTGIASFVVEYAEYTASKYYEDIYISPFDTSAMNFWKHMGYEPDFGGYYTKTFCEYEE